MNSKNTKHRHTQACMVHTRIVIVHVCVTNVCFPECNVFVLLRCVCRPVVLCHSAHVPQCVVQYVFLSVSFCLSSRVTFSPYICVLFYLCF